MRDSTYQRQRAIHGDRNTISDAPREQTLLEESQKLALKILNKEVTAEMGGVMIARLADSEAQRVRDYFAELRSR